MLVLNCNITIGTLTFHSAHEVEINSSWRNLTDTCTIKLPRRISNFQPGQFGTGSGARLDALIQRGLPVSVTLGYRSSTSASTGYMNGGTVFNGFVTAVKPGIPVTIECEDNMFLFKQLIVLPRRQPFKPARLTDILDYCNIKSVMPYTTLGDVTLSDFIIDKRLNTAAKVLNCLRDDLKIYSFIRLLPPPSGVGGPVQTLVVGQPYDISGNAPQVIFQFGGNIISYNELTYLDANDIKIQLEAVSKSYTRKDLTVIVGDSNGDKRTRFYYNINNKAQLTAMANRDIAYYKYTGYRGHFTGFGIPVISHGNIAVLQDMDYPDHNGSYYIDDVKTLYSNGGIRQTAELGPLATSVYQTDPST